MSEKKENTATKLRHKKEAPQDVPMQRQHVIPLQARIQTRPLITGSGRASLFPSGDSVQPSNMSARLCLVQGSEEASRQITLVEELMTRWDIV